MSGFDEVTQASSAEHGQKEALLDLKTGADADAVRAEGEHPSWRDGGLSEAADGLIGTVTRRQRGLLGSSRLALSSLDAIDY